MELKCHQHGLMDPKGHKPLKNAPQFKEIPHNKVYFRCGAFDHCFKIFKAYDNLAKHIGLLEKFILYP